MVAFLSTVSTIFSKSDSTNIFINWCIGSASVIPREFIMNTKIRELLSSNDNLSSAASSIMSSAVVHQETASESRIGLQVRRGSTRLEPPGLKRFKNTHKSAGSGTVSIRVERKERKAEWVEQQATTGPKFSVTLWKSRGIQEKPKQVWLSQRMIQCITLETVSQVNQVKCSRVYDASKPMRAVLDDLLDRLNDILKSQLGVEEDIRWYAFCNPISQRHYLTPIQGPKSRFLPRKMPKLEYPSSIFERMSNLTLQQLATGKRSSYRKGMVRKPLIRLGSLISVLLWMRN